MVLTPNPYRPGAGTTPAYLAGREQVLHDAQAVLENIRVGFPARSVIYYGLRGVGKTVLLNRIGEMADDMDVPVEYMEIAEREHSFQEAIVLHIYKLMSKLSPVDKLEGYVKKAMGILKAFSIKYTDSSAGIEIAFDPVHGIADTGNLTNDMTELFLALGRLAAKKEQGIALFIDEIQYINERDFEALIEALHRVNQKGYPLVIFAAGLPKIVRLAGKIKSYAERLFQFIAIDSLSKADAKLALEKPAAKMQVTFTHDAVEKVLAVTEGYPYFIQEYGKWIWENREHARVITPAIVERAYHDFKSTMDEAFFKVRHDRATPRELEFMTAMVRCGELPCNMKDVAQQLGESAQKVGPLRAQLIHKGFIYAPQRGTVAFTVPQFDKYLQRTYHI